MKMTTVSVTICTITTTTVRSNTSSCFFTHFSCEFISFGAHVIFILNLVYLKFLMLQSSCFYRRSSDKSLNILTTVQF